LFAGVETKEEVGLEVLWFLRGPAGDMAMLNRIVNKESAVVFNFHFCRFLGYIG
jgi:hypothetical protein